VIKFVFLLTLLQDIKSANLIYLNHRLFAYINE